MLSVSTTNTPTWFPENLKNTESAPLVAVTSNVPSKFKRAEADVAIQSELVLVIGSVSVAVKLYEIGVGPELLLLSSSSLQEDVTKRIEAKNTALSKVCFIINIFFKIFCRSKIAIIRNGEKLHKGEPS